MKNQNEDESKKKMNNCPKCNESIQIGAKKCKHCGSDLRNWFIRHKILTSLLFLFLIGIIGSMGDKNSDKLFSDTVNQESKRNSIKISSRELYSEYEENEIKADEKYKNKWLEVSGVISNIGKDILDNPYISLKTNNIIASVQCMLIDSEKSKASLLKKGELISLEGKNSGKLGNIIIRNCKVK